MKKRKSKPRSLYDRFKSTCGWCGKTIPPNTEVFSAGGKVRPGVDLSDKAGQVLPMYLFGLDKTVLVGVAGLDSDARRDGWDFVFMTCSRACGDRLRAAFQDEIELGDELGLD